MAIAADAQAGSRAGTSYLPGLTGLRGAAAVWVVLYHLINGADYPVTRLGYLGVDIFFILSGFVLCHVYALGVRDWRASDYLNFLMIRLARIYPLHFAMLCVLGMIVLVLPGFTDPYSMPTVRWGFGSFVASLFLVQNWGLFPVAPWNGPAWTLSAEWFAYLSFPVFVVLTQWPRSARLALMMAAVAIASLLCFQAWRGNLGGGGGQLASMVRMACEFCAGCCLHRAYASHLAWPGRWADFAVLALWIGAFRIALVDLAALPACLLLVWLAIFQQSWVGKLLTLAPLVWLGEISYSLYLVHWPVLQLSKWVLGHRPILSTGASIAWGTGLLVLSLLLSVGSYHLIERPARQFGRRLTFRRVSAARGTV